MKSMNSYNFNLPVHQDMLYGRSQDLGTLLDHLTGATGDSVALIGGRRIGKTSLLEAVARSLEDRNLESNRTVFLPVILDMSAFNTMAELFRTAHSEMCQVLSRSFTGWSEARPITSDTLDTPRDFANMIKRLTNEVRDRLGRFVRWILLLDECEHLVDRFPTERPRTVLRFLLQKPDIRDSIKVVMAGSHSFLTNIREPGSPVQNVLVTHFLGVLTEEATMSLINEPTGNQLPVAVARIVAEYSGGHPFLTQYIMHFLCREGLQQGNEESLGRIVDRFAHERDDFRQWCLDLGEESLLVYSRLCRRQAPTSENELRSELGLRTTYLLMALDALCYHGVVVNEGHQNRYRITGRMFKDWFDLNYVKRNREEDDSESILRLREEYGRFRSQYKIITSRLEAMDTDIGRALSSLEKQVLEERRAELEDGREKVESELKRIESQLHAP